MASEPSPSSFVETRWTLVRRTGQGGEGGAAALSELCALYHTPVERFVRQWCGAGEGAAERARDLTQEFFLRLLQRQHLGAAEAEKGRFRSYLLGAVKHFLCDMVDRSRALRRGGGTVQLSLDEVGDELPPGALEDRHNSPPDQEFDRQWALALLARALQTLEQEMDAEGRSTQFTTLKPWLAGNEAGGSLADCARELGVTESAIRVSLHRLRQRYRDTVRQQVAQTLDTTAGASVEEELQHLRAALLCQSQS